MRTLNSLQRRQIVTESGRKLGRCHDVRAELLATGLQVTGLVVGRHGRFEHLGIAGQASASSARVRDSDVVPWRGIVRLDGGLIVVRDDAVPTE
jgi:sporulation protein YlmC with PRC-barrel domain